MLSLSKVGHSPAIAYDIADRSPIYYTRNHGQPELKAQKEFIPLWYGDALLYCCGRRGSGKSTFCNMYLHSYANATSNRVFLVSRFDNDPSIQLPDRGARLSIDDLQSIQVADLSNSLIIFDDIHDAKLTKLQNNVLYSFILDVMENSRHYQISCVITSHMISNYAKTRPILNECSALIVFPGFSNRYQIEKSLKYYYGLTAQQIKDIMDIHDSRWVMITTVNPKYVLTSKRVYTYR